MVSIILCFHNNVYQLNCVCVCVHARQASSTLMTHNSELNWEPTDFWRYGTGKGGDSNNDAENSRHHSIKFSSATQDWWTPDSYSTLFHQMTSHPSHQNACLTVIYKNSSFYMSAIGIGNCSRTLGSSPSRGTQTPQCEKGHNFSFFCVQPQHEERPSNLLVSPISLQSWLLWDLLRRPLEKRDG
jgi:hypothetical protein